MAVMGVKRGNVVQDLKKKCSWNGIENSMWHAQGQHWKYSYIGMFPVAHVMDTCRFAVL